MFNNHNKIEVETPTKSLRGSFCVLTRVIFEYATLTRIASDLDLGIYFSTMFRKLGLFFKGINITFKEQKGTFNSKYGL